MAKVYLETSFFSACVSRRTDPKTAGWKVSSNEWWNREAQRHQLFISSEVLNELSAPDFPDSAPAVAMLQGLTLLALTKEVADFADLLVAERVMPAPAGAGDAIHVAAATLHRMHYSRGTSNTLRIRTSAPTLESFACGSAFPPL